MIAFVAGKWQSEINGAGLICVCVTVCLSVCLASSAILSFNPSPLNSPCCARIGQCCRMR